MSDARELVERAFASYNAGDADAMVDVYAADAVLRTPEGAAEGRAAIREFWAGQFSEFPDSHITSDLLVEQGDTIAVEFTYTGTNTGPLVRPDGSTLPATGKRVEMKGVQLVQLRDGKVIRHAVYHDEMAVMAQLGMMPGVAMA